MSHVTTKPAFGVCDQLRLKPACSATETSLDLEISVLASRGIVLSIHTANNKSGDHTVRMRMPIQCLKLALA